MPQQLVTYSDFDMNFVAHPITGALKVLKDNDAISQALKILVFTNQYDRLCQPNIFTNVRASLFENFTPSSAAILDNFITIAARNYENRAAILDLNVYQEDDEETIIVEITYAGIRQTQPVVVKLFLTKIR